MYLLNLTALLTGICMKLYDDIIDNKLMLESTAFMNGLKLIFATLLIILVFNDITTAFIFTIMSIACLCIGDADSNFWKMLAIIPIVALIINFQLMPKLIGKKLGYKIILLILGCLFLFLEPKMFPEEKSTKKTIFRLGLVLVFTISLIFNTYEDFQFIVPMNYFLLGYFITGLLLQNL